MNSNSLAYFKRTYFFIALIILFFLLATTKLIDYQIINSNKLTKLTTNKNKTKQLVSAARGDIIDRNGVVLATSGLNLSLVIDGSFPYANNKDDAQTKKNKNQEGNQILLNLINILENNNLDYDQNFPITKTYPYKFLEDKKSEENKLKAALNQQPYATPDDILNLLVEKYNIKGYNKAETVKIAAMRCNMLLSNFAQNKIFTVINSIDPEHIEKFIGTTINLKGVNIAETSKRLYPCEDVGAHIIGNVGPIYEEELEKYKNKNYKTNAIIGKYGIEKEYEDHLRPFDGFLTIEKLKNGQIKKYYEEEQEPKPGKTVRLTIDFEFQKRIQEALIEHIKNNSSTPQKGGAVVVLDATNGEVLAAVSVPSYDLNTYYENFKTLANDPGNALLNQALCGSFRPGSTAKIFIAAAGIYSNKLDPSFKCKCVPGAVLFPRMSCLQDQHKGTHTIDIYHAIKWSCNNYFYNVAKMIGIDTIDEMAPYFGYATDTGLEIYNIDGRITNPADFTKRGIPYTQGYTLQTGIGQAETYISPLQMAISAMVVGNKGKRFAAHIVKSVENYKGNEVIFTTQPKVLSQLDSNNIAWNIVKKGMIEMAKSRPALAKHNMATKSGSPEYSDTNKKLTNAAGVGFYPALEDSNEKPELAFSIMVHNSKYAVDFLGTIVSIWEDLKKERAQNQQ